jgi:hypothetical protein
VPSSLTITDFCHNHHVQSSNCTTPTSPDFHIGSRILFLVPIFFFFFSAAINALTSPLGNVDHTHIAFNYVFEFQIFPQRQGELLVGKGVFCSRVCFPYHVYQLCATKSFVGLCFFRIANDDEM